MSYNCTNSTLYGTISILEAFDGVAWAALGFNFIAIFICVYLCCFKVPFRWTRFKVDTHYRLRCSMSLLLCFNQLIALCRLFVNIELHRASLQNFQYFADNWTSLIAPMRAVSFVLEWLEVPMIYTICSLILFLTIDRYERVGMVLKRSRLYFFFSVVRSIVIFCLVYIWAVYGWSQLYNAATVLTERDFAIYPEKLKNVVYIFLYQVFDYIQYVVLTIGITVDYTITIHMIWMSVKSGKSSMDASDLNPTTSKPSKLLLRKIIINHQRTMVAVKMISLFIILWILDTATALTIASTILVKGVVTDFDFDMMVGMTTSWLSFRILAVFELMDMLLRELKSASHVNLPSYTYHNGGIAAASSQPDIVSNSLKSWNSDKPTTSNFIVSHSSFDRSVGSSSNANTGMTGSNITHSSFNTEYYTETPQNIGSRDGGGAYRPPTVNHKPRYISVD